MNTAPGEKKKGPRGLAALFLGLRSSSGDPPRAPGDDAAAKKPSPGHSGGRRFRQRASKFISKFSRDRSKAPVDPGTPQAPAEPEPSRAPAEPEPSRAPAEPEPSRAPAEPEPSRASAELEPSRAPAEPEPPQAPAEPGPRKSDDEPPRPDTESPKQVLASGDIHERAIQLVHQVLGPDAITLDGQASAKSLVGDILQDVQKKCSNRSSGMKMSRILKRIEHYFKIVDVAIQHQPQVVQTMLVNGEYSVEITALVWAGVRTIVQISLNHLDTLENLEQAIDSIPATLLMAEFYYSLYVAFVRVSKPTEVVHNTELLDSFISILPGLYADVIVFMVKAKGYFEPGSMTSAVGKFLVPFCLEFKPFVDGIMAKEAVLRKLMGNATMAQILENAEDLQVLKHKLDEWGEYLRENWKRLLKIEDKLSQVIDGHEREGLIKCRMWLRPLQHPDSELNCNLRSKTEGTCTWIRNTEEFGLTIEGGGKNHLWIEGKPGTGKSVLLSYLVYTTRKSATRKNPVLYFFCKDASPTTSTAAAIVANLIDQLVMQTNLESLLNILSAGREEHANSTYCTDFAILWGIFLRMVHEFPTRVIVFVDALDECSEKERTAFTEAIMSLPDNVCLCATSRGLPDIRRVFQDQDHQKKILRLEMQSHDDIITYLNESIDRNPRLCHHREKVLDKVAYHSRGMFRYAALLVGELLHSPCQNISARLESPPADLNEMYENILLRLDTEPPRDKPRHRAQRKRILQWVAVARQPLKPSELVWSCAAVQGEESFNPESIDIHPQELMELCSPLLEIVNGFVHFTHLSAKEFLFQKPEDLYSRNNNRGQIAFYLVDNIGAHISIATVGVALSRHVAGEKVKGCYPVNFWPRHAQDIVTSQEISRDIQSLWNRISLFLVDRPLCLAWMLEFPWKQVFGSVHRYWPIHQSSDIPHALHIASHYGLDEVLNRLLSAEIGLVRLRSPPEAEVLGGTPLLYAISGGFVRAVQRLLDFGVNVDTRCSWGTTPLGTAAGRGNEKITQLLLDRGAGIEVRDNSGCTPLSHAVRGGSKDVTRLLLDRGAEIETWDKSGWKPLSHAARSGSKDVTQLLLDRGAKIEARDNSGWTPLSHAARGGNEDVTQLLLDRGAEIETRNNSYRTPLSNATRGGRKNIMQLLLDRGAEIETRDNSGWTPLAHAARGGSKDVVKLLLDRGANIEARDSGGRTPLSNATQGGRKDVMQLLLDSGAEVEAQDNDSRTPLSHAAQGGREDVVRLLLDRGAMIEARDPNEWTPLSYAASGGSFDVVRLLLDSGAEIEMRTDAGETPLCIAVQSGGRDVVQLLLDRGAEIETRDNDGWAPLSFGAIGGSIDIVQLLLDRRAEIETRDNNGWAPLTFGVTGGSIDIVQLLLDRGAKTETRDQDGRTPLSHAVSAGLIGIAQLLLDHGAEVETRDNLGWTLLSHAAREGGENVMQLLLNRGADIEARNDVGWTPLSYAVLEEHVDVVRLLLDRGADLETRDNRGRTPLLHTARDGREDVVGLLLDRGADIEARDTNGGTPLVYAVVGGSIAVMQLLLDRGAETETRDFRGRTPLSRAARLGDTGAVLLLLNNGVAIETRGESGRTPLSHAAGGRAVDAVQLLLEDGADIEARDNGGRAPLSHAAEFAVSHGYSATLRFLLTWPTITIDSQDDVGLTAIDWAEAISDKQKGREKTASEEIVAILKTAQLQHGRNLFTDNGDGGHGAMLPSNRGCSSAC